MNISYESTFTQQLDSLPSNSMKYAFLYLSHCSALTTMTLLLLLLLVKFPQCRRSKRFHFDHTATSFGKGVHRNIRNMSFILGAKIIWRSSHAIRSSCLLDIFFLCHSYRRVFTVFYVIHTFWPPNRTFNAQNKWLRRTR